MLIDVQGVGYDGRHPSPRFRTCLKWAGKLPLYTHLAVRDDTLTPLRVCQSHRAGHVPQFDQSQRHRR
ncbi:MAG: hypothetical protein R3F37_05245 [Candidatus Competibacteraceae bacterium]